MAKRKQRAVVTITPKMGGKKKEYKVELNTGEVIKRVTARDYSHVIIGKRTDHNKICLLGFAGRLDLAESTGNTYRRRNDFYDIEIIAL